jgi:hypothetical protein
LANDSTYAFLEKQTRVLLEQAWRIEVDWPSVLQWLDNFTGVRLGKDKERLHALFLLTRFSYFNQALVRETLHSAYRDHFRAPMLQSIRRTHAGISQVDVLERYDNELKSTRFVGFGNPAESGAHLLYYFRQVNNLPKTLFSDLAAEFVPSRADTNGELLQYNQQHPKVKRLVFFDDLVGSGDQVRRYLGAHIKEIKRTYPKVDVRCIVLFATTDGERALKEIFGDQYAVIFEIDASFKAFSASSRYFKKRLGDISKESACEVAAHYGAMLFPGHPVGWKDGQLLLGFFHNTPDNTLPIFWAETDGMHRWQPIFKRFDKKYS